MFKNLSNEVWRDIENYEGLYQISNLGRVRSLNYLGHGRVAVLKSRNCGKGYLKVVLSKDKKPKEWFIHRLVAIAFIPNPHNLPCVNHKDENKLNNIVENLEWCTHKYNANYGTAIQRRVAKMINNPSKSKPVGQYTLQWDLIATYPSAREAARQTGFSQGGISDCCRGEIKTAGGYIWYYI